MAFRCFLAVSMIARTFRFLVIVGLAQRGRHRLEKALQPQAAISPARRMLGGVLCLLLFHDGNLKGLLCVMADVVLSISALSRFLHDVICYEIEAE